MRSPDNVHYRKPFGGRHIVLVGDVAQLPVIQGKGIWDEPLFYEYFKIANLTTNKRQKDSNFLTVLNKIRLGNIDQHVQDYLNQHTIDGDLESNPDAFNIETTFILTPHRQTRDHYNKIITNRLPDDNQWEYRSIDIGPDGRSLSEKTLEYGLKHSKCMFVERLVLRKGARVILLRNMDIKNGWVNGTICRVMDMMNYGIWVCKDSNRNETKYIMRQRWNITPKNHSGDYFRIQFPLDLAYALTIHKIQGFTLDDVILDMKNVWQSGQAYVAISRVKNDANLKIISYDKENIK
ncbi:RRM3/PIF1 helicase-like protein, partial [Leptotrombidium deliense]